MKSKFNLIAAAGVLLIAACEKIKESESHFPILKGVFVVNEGAFGQSNGDISFFSDDGNARISKLFEVVNKRPLGDVVQSMTIIGDRAWLVANNSQKIEVVTTLTFKSVGVINGFASPRYIVPVNDSIAYVSDWSANTIKIINLSSLSITGNIPAGNGPEQMLQVGSKVYVTNVGGFGNDSTVTVINTLSNSVINTLHVGVNPNSIQRDTSGMLWILCGGTLGPDYTPNTADDIGGTLLKIDPSTDAIIHTFNFLQGEHPLKLTTNANKDKLYFLRGSSAYTGNICMMDINAVALPAGAIINREFYGLGIHPKNENMYGAIGSFSADSWVLRYNNTTQLLDSIRVGIGPNGFVFNVD